MLTAEQQDALLKKIESLEKELSVKNAELSVKDEKISSLDKEVASLKDELSWLRKKIFGKMSEKHLPLDPNQLNLFEPISMSEEEKSALNRNIAESESAIAKSIIVSKKPSRKPLDLTGLPIEENHIYPEGTTESDGSLKDDYIEIGKEESLRLERIPSKTYIVKTIRHKLILRSDVSDKYPEERSILTPCLPLLPVSKCMAGATVLTDIILGKFMYHLPFYRIIQQYRESGITISDSTMGGWYEAACEKLKLLYDLLRKKILSSEYIQIDESVIPVIDNEKHKTRKGYEWCVRDGLTGDVMFYYDRGSRSGAVANRLLGSYHGTVQCDGYEVYEQFEQRPGITLAGCWAHARRKFTESLDENRSQATIAISYIGRLYEVEKEADESCLTAEERKEKRQKISYPVIRTFEQWLMDQYTTVLPQSRMGKAIKYTYSLMPRLSRYVNDGSINIDNNLIENSIRPLAIGRKNYLFCGNDASAYRAAIVYSLIGTCKAAGVDSRIWMEDVLQKIPYYQLEGRDMTELLPSIWARSLQVIK